MKKDLRSREDYIDEYQIISVQHTVMLRELRKESNELRKTVKLYSLHGSAKNRVIANWTQLRLKLCRAR